MAGRVTPIGDIVRDVFSKIESGKTIVREDVEKEWKGVAGDTAAKHSRPVSLRKTVLTVYVDTSGWLQVLSIQKRKILKGLQRTFGKDKISEIQLKIGEI